MGQQAQQSGGGGDNSMAPVWLSIFFILAFVIIWKVAHQHIVAFIFRIMVWEAKLVSLFINDARLNQTIYDMQTIKTAITG